MIYIVECSLLKHEYAGEKKIGILFVLSSVYVQEKIARNDRRREKIIFY